MSRPIVITDVWRAQLALALMGQNGLIAPKFAVVTYYASSDTGFATPKYTTVSLVPNAPTTYVAKQKGYIPDISSIISEDTGVYVKQVDIVGPTKTVPSITDTKAVTNSMSGASSQYTMADIILASNKTGVGNVSYFGPDLTTLGPGATAMVPSVTANDSIPANFKGIYDISIDTTGATDNFTVKRIVNGTPTTLSTGNNCSLTAVEVDATNHISVKFAAITGHTAGARWQFNAGGMVWVDAGAGSNFSLNTEVVDATIPA